MVAGTGCLIAFDASADRIGINRGFELVGSALRQRLGQGFGNGPVEIKKRFSSTSCITACANTGFENEQPAVTVSSVGGLCCTTSG
jgi:hypothetical protein